MNKNINKKDSRLYLPTLADLIDQLAIDQIKEVLKPENKNSYAREIKKIGHDIDILIEEKQLKLSARLIRIIITLAQLNLHIWHHKDKMQHDQKHYSDLLKFAHQLNGLRNQMKNLILEETGYKEPSVRKTNFNTDGLDGWEISIK